MAMVEEVKEEATEIKLQRSWDGWYWYQCKCKSNANQSMRSQDAHIGGNASPPATKHSNFVFLLQNENEKRVFGYEFQFY